MVITTFEMILADCPELKKIQWRCVVIDEAHRLKNRNCKLLEGLKLMALVSTARPAQVDARAGWARGGRAKQSGVTNSCLAQGRS